MSGGALFSNNAVRGATKNLVEMKAGKMTVKGKMIYPDTRKGLLYIYQSDDSLMHFCWKDRTSGTVEDDLIIFPDDCEFKHVTQCKTGRVYLLKFKLSSKKFFFWLQDIKTDKDEEHCKKINEVLNNPPTALSQRSGGPNPEGDLQNLLNNMSQQQLMQLFGGVGQMGLGSLLGTMRDRQHNSRTSNSSSNSSNSPATTTASTTTTTSSSTPVTTSATRPPAAQTPAPTTATESSPRSSSGTPKNNSSSKPGNNMNLLDRAPNLLSDSHVFDIHSNLWDVPIPPGAEPIVQRGVATELTNSIPGAITATESLELTMTKHLPIGDSLSTTISSPQFSQALSMFWSALQSGQAGPVIRQFGLGSDAVNAAATGNLEQFVTALESEIRSDDQATTLSDSKTTTSTTSSANPDPSATATTTSPSSKNDDKDDEMALD